MRDTLIVLEYLKVGLVPVDGFQPESIEKFNEQLVSLSKADRKLVNRRFRKVFRKIARREMARPNRPTDGWKKTYGVGETNPTPQQLRNRRRLVHEEISNTIWRRLKNG